MKLHENTELFNEVLLKASEIYKLNPSQIEKDYWTTEILHQLYQSEYADNIYFGGGTSLMKSFGLINRFSEDLDLYIDTNESQSGQGKENTLNSKVFNFIKEKNAKFKSDQPDRLSGGTRAIHLNTNSLYTPQNIKSHLLIELSISTTKRKAPTYHPSESRIINSLAVNYLKTANKKLYDNLDNKDFPFNCISPKEILCAKISRLIRVSGKIDTLTQKIRDLYDLYKLMQDPVTKQFFLSEEFKEGMFLTSMQDWLQHKRIHTQYPYAESIFFTQPEQLLTNQKVLSAYKDLEKLLFANESLPPLPELTRLILSMRPTIESFDSYKNKRKDEYVLAEFTAWFKEKPETRINDYILIKEENKPITRLCHITIGKPYTLVLDYKTGDICKTKGFVQKSDISKKVWQTIDNKPAYASKNRVVSYKNKHILQGID